MSEEEKIKCNSTEVQKKFNKSEFINAIKSDFVTTIRKIYINTLDREFGFREITVKEQKQLSRIMIDNEQRKDIIYDAQCAMINQVCLDNDFDIYTLTEFDKIKLIIALYQTNMFKNEVKFKCKECGTENVYKLEFAKVLDKLDSLSIEDKKFVFDNDTWKFEFNIGYPNVSRVSAFYRHFAKKCKNATKKELNTLNAMMNSDYIMTFIKDVTYTNKKSDISKTIHVEDFSVEEAEDMFSVFPQDVLYVDDGILTFITDNFIKSINATFDKHACAQCGATYEEAIDNGTESFF